MPPRREDTGRFSKYDELTKWLDGVPNLDAYFNSKIITLYPIEKKDIENKFSELKNKYKNHTDKNRQIIKGLYKYTKKQDLMKPNEKSRMPGLHYRIFGKDGKYSLREDILYGLDMAGRVKLFNKILEKTNYTEDEAINKIKKLDELHELYDEDRYLAEIISNAEESNIMKPISRKTTQNKSTSRRGWRGNRSGGRRYSKKKYFSKKRRKYSKRNNK